MTDQLNEVKKLREVPGNPVCCGQSMKKMSGAPMGDVKIVFHCERCGTQQRPPKVPA